jgi:type IX secretion system PorP/SprF family membrane protein
LNAQPYTKPIFLVYLLLNQFLLKFLSLIVGFFLVLNGHLLIAQDIHFSQFNGSLLNLSPGHTGLFDGDYRLGAIFRSQWSSVPVSYSTFSMHGENRLRPPALKKDMIGLGFLFNSDKAGDARYGSNQFYFNANYIYLAKPDSSLILTLGGGIGFCNVGFDYSKMTFQKQFDGYAYNPGLPTGESYGRTNRNFFDFNLGSVVQYIYKAKHRFTYAISFNHLSRPVISYQGNDLSRLDLKFSNCFSYSRPINDKTDIIAEALFSYQGKNYELIPHVSLKYYMNKDEQKAILAGLCLRARDAVILRVGYHNKTMQSGIAYDINVSKFNAATNRRGAFEVFINYVFKTKSDFTPKKRRCPVFL